MTRDRCAPLVVGALTQTKSLTNRRRLDVYFHVPLTLGQKSLTAEVHVFSTDGSIEEHRGRFYAAFDGNIDAVRGISPGSQCFPAPCPRCAAELMVPAAARLMPELELRGYPIAQWREPGGWYLFQVRAPALSGIEWTGRNRYAGPELVIAEYKQTLRCPFHGPVVRYDVEPID